MQAYNFFLDERGHLRSGWRLAIFAIAFLIALQMTHLVLVATISIAFHISMAEIAGSNWSVLTDHGSILIAAFLVGWGCGALLEELPIRALGCSPHPGWFRNLALGSVL